MMKIFLKALAVLVLAAIGAGGVLYMDGNCPQKMAERQKAAEQRIALYLNNNPQAVLEAVSKSENFGATVRNFSNIGDEELNKRLQAFLENNPFILENFISNNAEFVAQAVINSEAFKQAAAQAQPAGNNEEKAEESAETAQNNPNQIFIDHWDEMRNSEIAPYAGPADAKVAVVEFFDFACGHCKALAPIMSRLIKDNPDVKFVFHPLYFMSEHSPYAAKASLAAFKKGKFVEVFDGMMTLPELNEEAINQILTDEGLNVEEIKKMTEEKEIRRGIQEIDSLSQVLGINGVPMLLINGEPFYGRSYEDLQNKLNSMK